MKKLHSYIYLVLVLYSGRLLSQENSHAIGFYFSPTANSYWENVPVIENLKLGFSAGVGFDFTLSDNVSFLTGVEYENKGA